MMFWLQAEVRNGGGEPAVYFFLYAMELLFRTLGKN